MDRQPELLVAAAGDAHGQQRRAVLDREDVDGQTAPSLQIRRIADPGVLRTIGEAQLGVVLLLLLVHSNQRVVVEEELGDEEPDRLVLMDADPGGAALVPALDGLHVHLLGGDGPATVTQITHGHGHRVQRRQRGHDETSGLVLASGGGQRNLGARFAWNEPVRGQDHRRSHRRDSVDERAASLGLGIRHGLDGR